MDWRVPKGGEYSQNHKAVGDLMELNTITKIFRLQFLPRIHVRAFKYSSIPSRMDAAHQDSLVPQDGCTDTRYEGRSKGVKQKKFLYCLEENESK